MLRWLAPVTLCAVSSVGCTESSDALGVGPAASVDSGALAMDDGGASSSDASISDANTADAGPCEPGLQIGSESSAPGTILDFAVSTTGLFFFSADHPSVVDRQA